MQAMTIGRPTLMRQLSIAASFVSAKAGGVAPISTPSATIQYAFMAPCAQRRRPILEASPDRILKPSETDEKSYRKTVSDNRSALAVW
jgi:hypothetical protein